MEDRLLLGYCSGQLLMIVAWFCKFCFSSPSHWIIAMFLFGTALVLYFGILHILRT